MQVVFQRLVQHMMQRSINEAQQSKNQRIVLRMLLRGMFRVDNVSLMMSARSGYNHTHPKIDQLFVTQRHILSFYMKIQ